MGTYEKIRLRVSDEAFSFQGAEDVKLDGSDPLPDRLVTRRRRRRRIEASLGSRATRSDPARRFLAVRWRLQEHPAPSQCR